MEDMRKKILIKIAVILFFTALLLIIYFSFFNKNNNTEVNSSIYTGDGRLELGVASYYMRDIDKFFSSVKDKEYDLAFSFLSEECKTNLFSNNLSNFEEKIKNIFNTEICEKMIKYETMDEEKEKGKKVYVVKGIIYFEKISESFKGNPNSQEFEELFSVKKFTFRVKENRPFEYDYYFSVE